jgi:hypothetical protein
MMSADQAVSIVDFHTDKHFLEPKAKNISKFHSMLFSLSRRGNVGAAMTMPTPANAVDPHPFDTPSSNAIMRLRPLFCLLSFVF